jgi:peptidoglycan-associated lipoprotein
MKKLSIFSFLISGLFLNACVLPPEKGDIDADAQSVTQQENDLDNPLFISPKDRKGSIEVTALEDDSNLVEVSEELQDQNNQTTPTLPRGLQELADSSTKQYYIATQEELKIGRKEEESLAALLELGLQPTIYFGFDHSQLSEESKQILLAYKKEFFINEATSTVAITLTLEGHTDQVGTTQYNLSLGFKRALSIKEFLLEQGIPENALKIESFGEERPVFEIPTEEYQRYNRRVEIYFASQRKE